MLRAWMMESVKPASHHDTLPGRWIAEPSWPSPGITPRRLFLTDEGLRDDSGTFDGSRRVLAADGRQVCRQLGSIRSWARSGRRPARRRHALAGFRDAATRCADRDPRRARSSRSMSRPTGRLRIWWFGYAMCTRPVNRCVSALACSTSRIATDTNSPRLLATGRALPGAHPAQRCGLGVPSRPQGEACDIHGLLADDLASPEKATRADFWRHARSAGTLAQRRRRAALAISRTGDRRHPRSRRLLVAMMCGLNASTASVWNWARRARRNITLRRTIRSAPWPNCDSTQTMSRDGMANPHRDADAAVIHAQCLPAAGKFARLGGREGSLSSRLGSLHSSRFLMIDL